MRIVYADPGLASEVGHHANACRLITGALRARGHAPEIYTYHRVEPAVALSIGARPHFQASTYWFDDGDPLCGWLGAFFAGAEMLFEDLRQLGPWRREDLLYVNSILPTQLLGLGMFLARLPAGERPCVVAELGTEPGLDYVDEGPRPGFVPRDPRRDPRATLYRFAARQIEPAALTELQLCAFDQTAAEVYTQLLGLTVNLLPVPHLAAVTPRLRGQGGRRVIGVIGHQRPEKGYALVPGMCEQLLRERDDIELLVHNAEPGNMAEAQAALRAMAARDGRLRLDERPAGPAIWASLLDACDLIVCPYERNHFRAAYSAVASEAIAHGIPLVVPSGTTLARLVETFGAMGAKFEAETSESVAAAVIGLLDQFATVARGALAAARLWQSEMGAENMVEALLGLVECSALSGAMMAARGERALAYTGAQ